MASLHRKCDTIDLDGPSKPAGQMFWQCAAAGMLTLLPYGCSDGDSTAKYSPATDTARQALQGALDAWKRGEPPGKVTGLPIAVEVSDSKRQRGQTLSSFEITGEIPSDAGKGFSVRLNLENPQEEQQVRYIVVGRDPIWVFREEDYKRADGM